MYEESLGYPQSDEERLRLEAEMQQLQEAERDFIEKRGKTEPDSVQQPSTVDQNTSELDPAKTSPYRKDDGSLDMDKLRSEGDEFDSSLLTGLQDTAIDALNFLIPGEDFDIQKTSPFENEVAQTFRDMSAIVIPTAGLSSVGTKVLSGLSKTQKVKDIPKLYNFLNDPAVKWFGPRLFAAGTGAAVDYVAETNQRDDNLSGYLKQTWPRQFGWIPDSLATTDLDSPDVKRYKNVSEGAALGFLTDTLAGLLKFSSKKIQAYRALDRGIVPESEKAKVWFEKNVVIDDTPEDVVERMATKRSKELDKVGELNLDRQAREEAVDPTKPLFGYNDVFAPQEQGIRSVDDFGIVGAATDAARISLNLDSTYGRVGSVLSDAAIKFANESGKNGEIIINGLAQQLKDSDKFGYYSAKGKYLSHAEIMSIGQQYADDLYGLSLKQLEETIYPGSKYQGKGTDTETPELTTEAYAGAMSAIRRYMNDYMNMDLAMARAYTATSISGQISDLAQGMRLTDGSGTIARAQEQILDRVEFLMAQVGMTRYTRGRALNMLNLWKRLGTYDVQKANMAAEAKRLQKLIGKETNSTLKAIERIKQDSTDMVDRLREISKTRPNMLGPLMMAYELTDGKVNSITSLNNFVKKSSATWSKAIFDADPEIPSLVNRAFFASTYNNILSAVATPMSAIMSGNQLLVEKPIKLFAGALLTQDAATMRRAMYQYSNNLESIMRGLDYAKMIYKKSALDPEVLEVRDNVLFKDRAQLEVFNATADALAEEGNLSMQFVAERINLMVDVADHARMRSGTRFMQAMDGFVQSMIADFEAKGRAFDRYTKGGQLEFDKAKAKSVYKDAHAEMFDEDGIITDKAVRRAASELSFNMDSQFNTGFQTLINRMPVLKPFFMFTKTPINELQFTSSHVPFVRDALSRFNKDLDQFRFKFDDLPTEKVKSILEERGIEFEPLTAKAKYNELRADIKGRRALGGLLIMSATGLFFQDRLTGTGHYNRQVQKTRRKSDWQPMSIKGLDGKWYSYEGLGPVTTFLATTADIADHFDVLAPNDIQNLLGRLTHIFGASFLEQSYMAGFEPFQDVFRGDVGALNRWSSSFLTGAVVPRSSQMAEIARIMDPGAKQINNDLVSMVFARLPLLRSTLPVEYDWIDGDEVGGVESFFARVINQYLPWKVGDKISPEKQFLIDVEYDATATLKTNGAGVALTNEMQSEVLSKLGEHGIWKAAIKDVMDSVEGKEFRKKFKEFQALDGATSKGDVLGVHRFLDKKLRESIRAAIYDSKYLTKIQRLEHEATLRKEFQMRGDLKGLKRWIELKEKMDKKRRNP